MKTFSCILFLLLSTSIYSQEKEYSENVDSIDTIIETLYSVISGEKNEARNWELFQYLFH